MVNLRPTNFSFDHTTWYFSFLWSHFSLFQTDWGHKTIIACQACQARQTCRACHRRAMGCYLGSLDLKRMLSNSCRPRRQPPDEMLSLPILHPDTHDVPTKWADSCASLIMLHMCHIQCLSSIACQSHIYQSGGFLKNKGFTSFFEKAKASYRTGSPWKNK